MSAPDWLVEHEHDRVLRLAGEADAARPTSIVDHPAPLSPGGPHDFFSMSDYCWPDPDDPAAAFVHRDGESYPGLFTAHREALMAMRDAVAAASAAHLITGDPHWVDVAGRWLSRFFIDEATAMTPWLEHAQVIVNKPTPTRGIGLIDTLHLAEAAVAVDRFGAALPDAVRVPVTQWFAEYLHWFLTSARGREEAVHPNNHAGAYWLQVAAFTRLVPDPDRDAACRRRFTELLTEQQAADGSFPAELSRTKPYAYSIFVLDNLATLAALLGPTAWRDLPDGRGLRAGIGYLAPFLSDKGSWPCPPDVMVWEHWPTRQIALLLGGLALDRPDWLELWRSLPADPGELEIRRNNAVTQPVLWAGERLRF